MDRDTAFLRDFALRLRRSRVPVSGGISLTHRCNLRCVHCYLGSEGPPCRPSPAELDTAVWLDIIDQVAGAGCLNLLITGGEPLLRRDFARIYSHAKKKGLLVTVFTNATLVTEETAALFGELPPQAVEVSLYGATEETCERVTGVAGSYGKCMTGIGRMLEAGVRVGIKTIMMTVNQHELDGIRSVAERLGVSFRFDAAIFPRFSGDRSPVDLRVDCAAAIGQEVSDPDFLASLRKQFDRLSGLPPSEGLYHCGAGLTAFHVDCAGNLLPCLMSGDPVCNLVSGGPFLEAWRDIMPRVRAKKADSERYACGRCDKRPVCSFCPEFHRLETGDASRRSDYLCSLAHARYEHVR